MATKSSALTAQFGMLPKAAQEAIFRDLMAGDNPQPTLAFNVGGKPVTGTVFKDDEDASGVAVGPLTQAADVPAAPGYTSAPVDISGIDSSPMEPKQVGALTQAAPRSPQVDIMEMLKKFVPEDASSSKYLALAAGFGRPSGSFGETMGNVASALMEQKQNQQKLRAQYVPLIMQQVAAQQAREEQAAIRAEQIAQQQAFQAQQAQQAQQERAAQAELVRQQQAQQAELNRQAAAERAAQHAELMKGLQGDKLAAATTAKETAILSKPEPPAQIITTPEGVFERTRDGNLKALTNPGTGKPLSGKTDPQEVSAEAKVKDAKDALDIIGEARKLIPNATGSGIGAARDAVAGWFGASTDGAKVGAQLKALQGMLVSKMPKMSGPQSDKDVVLYQQMAGQIGDASIPPETRMAALDVIERLQQKYAGVAPAQSAPAPATGSWSIKPKG